MSSFGIIDWNNGEAFAVYNARLDPMPLYHFENQKMYELCCGSEKNVVLLNHNSIDRYQRYGQWPDMTDGDIVYINRDGSVQIQYQKGQAEVDLFITNKCNSNCVMCPLSENVRKKNAPGQIQWVLDYIDLLPADIPYINITGGEPTLEKERFIKVLERLKLKFQNTEFQLLTNGRSLADRHFLLKLAEYVPFNMRFAIPFHSSCEDIHDAITQSVGSFRQTDYAIRNLLDLQQKVELRIVLSRLNIPTVQDTVKYIEQEFKGVFVVNFVGMEMMGNAARNRTILWEDYPQVFQEIRDSVRYLVTHGIDAQLYNFPLCAVDPGYRTIIPKSISGYKIRYKEECSECAVKDICGGFFFSTLNLMNPSVQVIREK